MCSSDLMATVSRVDVSRQPTPTCSAVMTAAPSSRSRMQPAFQRVAHAVDGIKARKAYSLEDEAEAPLAGRDGIPTPAPTHRHLGLRIFGERGAGFSGGIRACGDPSLEVQRRIAQRGVRIPIAPRRVSAPA